MCINTLSVAPSGHTHQQIIPSKSYQFSFGRSTDYGQSSKVAMTVTSSARCVHLQGHPYPGEVSYSSSQKPTGHLVLPWLSVASFGSLKLSGVEVLTPWKLANCCKSGISPQYAGCYTLTAHHTTDYFTSSDNLKITCNNQIAQTPSCWNAQEF